MDQCWIGGGRIFICCDEQNPCLGPAAAGLRLAGGFPNLEILLVKRVDHNIDAQKVDSRNSRLLQLH